MNAAIISGCRPNAASYFANGLKGRAKEAAGKVKKKITAIVDTGRVIENPMTLNPASEQAAGVLQYWREE